MKLYFIRHGRTEWNEEGRFQGSNGDSPLLPASIHQLEKLGKHLATVPFDAALQVICHGQSILHRSFSINWRHL